DDVLAGEDALPDRHLTGAGQGPVPLDILDGGRADQALQALVEPADDPVLVGVDLGDVDRVEGGVDAELRARAGGVGDLGGVQQRLGRDAAAVQAGAAELV